ncbi:MAG TPA: large-conductance mechanosensitive channel protein MscL [Steroidobacteraceae bacterium]|jgi:large conductance mechanosensitive channel|nr:large-conductance mechanosensitive channel protein MscL [Steroidobacteraceae bacterium]
MSLTKEFKEFAMRGNVIDLAVGVVIGAAFGTVVNTTVNGIIMPVVGVLTSGKDFSEMAVRIGTDPKGTAVLLKYGQLVQSVVNFLIIAAVLFLAVKGINALKKPPPAPAEAAPPAPPRNEVLLEEIRDLLAQRTGANAAVGAGAGPANRNA